jgi:hypothetical protein
MLASQPQHERAHLSREGRAPAPAGRLPPLPAHQRAMPAQQRPRGDQTRAARGGWQVAGRRRQQARSAARSCATWRRRDLELVTKDEQLDVLDVQPAATANERA